MELWEHQVTGVKEYFKGKRLLAFSIGSGKTRMALSILSSLEEAYGSVKTLVLAPISAHKTWLKECCAVRNTVPPIMSYEMFLKRDLDYGSFDFVIFDEIHKFKSASAKRTKKAIKVFERTKWKLGLTGTAIAKKKAVSMSEIYSQLAVLDTEFWRAQHIYGYRQFLSNFFVVHPDFFYPKYITKENQKRIERIIEPMVLTWERDKSTLPDVHHINEEFDVKIPLESEIMDLGDFQKVLGEASGFNRDGILVNPCKVNYLLDKLEESEEKSIIFCRFLHEVEYLRKALKSCYVITGKDKRDLDAALTKGEKHIVSTYALKEGADGLQNNYAQVFFFSIPLSYRDYQQSIGRVYRAGQTRKVVVYNLLGGWIDQHVHKIVMSGGDALQHFMRRFSSERTE